MIFTTHERGIIQFWFTLPLLLVVCTTATIRRSQRMRRPTVRTSSNVSLRASANKDQSDDDVESRHTTSTMGNR